VLNTLIVFLTYLFTVILCSHFLGHPVYWTSWTTGRRIKTNNIAWLSQGARQLRNVELVGGLQLMSPSVAV